MEIKILQVFYDKNGLPYKDKERTVHYPITSGTFLGASNTTQIRFYYDQLDELNESTFVAVSKLPNGKIGSEILENEYDSELQENYAVLNLSQFYTQYKGDVFISLQGYQGGVRVEQDEDGIYQIYGTPTIQATGSIKLSIAYAPTFIGSGQTENITLQRVLAELSTKLGIRQETLHVEELPTVGNPNVWYVVNDDPNNPNLANIYVWNGNTRHYIWVGDNTLDLGEYYTKEQGEQFESDVDNRVASVENELSSVASGSPAGVYATVSDLTTAHPDGDNKIYVVLADGHWYYWNGSAWADGGVYLQADYDNELNENSTNAVQNAVVTNAIKKLNNFQYGNDGSLFDLLKLNNEHNLINPNDVVNNKYWDTQENYNVNYFYAKIPVTAGTRYNGGIYRKDIDFSRGCRYVSFYNSSDELIGSVLQNVLSVVAPAGSSYAMVSFAKSANNGYLNGCTFYADTTAVVNAEQLKYPYISYEGIFIQMTDNNFMQGISPNCIKGLVENINLFDKVHIYNGYLNSNGSLESNDSYKTSSLIEVKAGKTYKINAAIRKLGLFTYSYGNAYYFLDVYTSAGYEFTPTQNGYVRFSFGSSVDVNTVLLIELDTAIEYKYYPQSSKKLGDEIYIGEKQLSTVVSKSLNLYNYQTNVVGYLESNGNVTANDSYSTSQKILIENGKTYIITQRTRKIGAWDNDGNQLFYETNSQAKGYSFTATADGYLRISLFVSQGIDKAMVLEGNTIPDYLLPYGKTLNNAVKLNKDQYDQIKENQCGLSQSVLNSKKWYACGDSFTYNGYDYPYSEEAYLKTGKYARQFAVYPFYIGNRTNCDVHNVALGGMTLATETGQTNSFTYNNQYQTLVGADADYITLYFGINDSHHSIPIGTIDDNTTDTFYGAWNVVIAWLLENRPNAKIGIIISNGCDTTAYPEATIAICQKWGIPYLDINGDDKLPMVIRTNKRTNLSNTAKTYWLNKYKISDSNSHPNAKAHEAESYMIQQFLERL